MATLEAQIESYVGDATAESGDLATFLANSANWIIDMAPLSVIEERAQETTVSTSGLDVGGARVVAVKSDTNGYNCRKIMPSQVGEYTKATSLLKATAYDPVFYMYGDKLYISEGSTPTTGKAYIISHLLDSGITPSADTALYGLPTSINQIAVVNSAIMVLIKRMQSKFATISSTYISATAPTALQTPSFTAPDTADYSYTAITAASALSLSTQYTELDTVLDSEEDIELAMAKINEIKARIEEWNTVYSEALARLKADKENKLAYANSENAAVLAEEVQQYDATVKRYAQELALYSANVQRGLEIARLDTLTIRMQIKELKELYSKLTATLLGVALQPTSGKDAEQ